MTTPLFCCLCDDRAVLRVTGETGREILFCQDHAEKTGQTLIELAYRIDGGTLAEWVDAKAAQDA